MQTLIRKPLAALHAMGGTHLQRSLTRQIKHVIVGHRANHPKDDGRSRATRMELRCTRSGRPAQGRRRDLDGPTLSSHRRCTRRRRLSSTPPLARSRQGGPPPCRRWMDRAQMALLYTILRATLGQIEARQYPTRRPWMDQGQAGRSEVGRPSSAPPLAESR